METEKAENNERSITAIQIPSSCSIMTRIEKTLSSYQNVGISVPNLFVVFWSVITFYKVQLIV